MLRIRWILLYDYWIGKNLYLDKLINFINNQSIIRHFFLFIIHLIFLLKGSICFRIFFFNLSTPSVSFRVFLTNPLTQWRIFFFILFTPSVIFRVFLTILFTFINPFLCLQWDWEVYIQLYLVLLYSGWKSAEEEVRKNQIFI